VTVIQRESDVPTVMICRLSNRLRRVSTARVRRFKTLLTIASSKRGRKGGRTLKTWLVFGERSGFRSRTSTGVNGEAHSDQKD
jgi:hypothetical protein